MTPWLTLALLTATPSAPTSLAEDFVALERLDATPMAFDRKAGEWAPAPAMNVTVHAPPTLDLGGTRLRVRYELKGTSVDVVAQRFPGQGGTRWVALQNVLNGARYRPHLFAFTGDAAPRDVDVALELPLDAFLDQADRARLGPTLEAVQGCAPWVEYELPTEGTTVLARFVGVFAPGARRSCADGADLGLPTRTRALAWSPVAARFSPTPGAPALTALRAGDTPRTLGDYLLLLQEKEHAPRLVEKRGATFRLVDRSGPAWVRPEASEVDLANGYLKLSYGLSTPGTGDGPSEEHGLELEAALFTTRAHRTFVIVVKRHTSGEVASSETTSFEFKGREAMVAQVGLSVRWTDVLDEAWASTPDGRAAIAAADPCDVATNVVLPRQGTTVTVEVSQRFRGLLLPDDPSTAGIVRCDALLEHHQSYDAVQFEWNDATAAFTRGKKTSRAP